MDFSVLTGWARLTVIFETSQLVSIYCTLDLQTQDKLPAEREQSGHFAGSRFGLL